MRLFAEPRIPKLQGQTFVSNKKKILPSFCDDKLDTDKNKQTTTSNAFKYLGDREKEENP